jgi:ribosome-binding protein aMBF1 (putative translation factor)
MPPCGAGSARPNGRSGWRRRAEICRCPDAAIAPIGARRDDVGVIVAMLADDPLGSACERLDQSKRLRVGDFRVIFTETADTIIILDVGPRGAIYEQEPPMPVMTKSPKGDDIVILSRKEYDRLLVAANEDLTDTALARKAIARKEETLTEAEMDELLAATTPLKFWRKKRGLTQTEFAKAARIAQGFLSEIESGMKTGDVAVLQRIATALEISLLELVPELHQSIGKPSNKPKIVKRRT